LIIGLGWAGSGVRDELLVWVQDIFTASLEPLADFLAISLAGFAQRLKSLWAYRSDHLADLGQQAQVNFLQRGPTAHHEIPDGYGELAGNGGDRQVDAPLGGQQLLAPASQGTFAGAQDSLGALDEQTAQELMAVADSPLSSKAG
jgi:hypothetical protein